MLMGLCMSCFLIGALWFLIGIGDAIVFRDSMQEVADHAAFTSAALHAKGMNFISACNLIMLAMIAIHIILGIIHDILLAICILAAGLSFGTACIPWSNWRPVYVNYAKVMKRAADAVHLVEVAAAYGYPYIGFAKAYNVGDDYGSFAQKKRDLNVLALSPSMVPGKLLNAPLNALFKKKGAGPVDPATGAATDDDSLTSTDTRKGLPVEAFNYQVVCKKIGTLGFDTLFGMSGKAPGGEVLTLVRRIVGDVLAFRYCNPLGNSKGNAGAAGTGESSLGDVIGKGNDTINKENKWRSKHDVSGSISSVSTGSGGGGSIDPGFDQWWGNEGPLLPWPVTMNGGPWQQVWAVNLLPKFEDGSEHRVALAERKLGIEQSAKPSAYMAQAEFYFDCTKGWTDPECNGSWNAGFSLKWRARMRRLQFPEVGSLLATFGASFLLNMKGYDRLQSMLKNSKVFDRLGSTVGGAIGTTAIGSVIDQMIAEMNSAVRSEANDIGKAFNPQFPGIYH